MTPSEILMKHEDANEYHFHDVDREWIIEAMKEYANIRSERLNVLARLLAKCWFYGDWKWETPNERSMQMIMQELGYYPFKNEDEMMQETRVDEDLYRRAVDSVPLRKPRMPLCDESNSISLTFLELPSDEEIHNEAFKQTRYSDSFIRGAKWMRDKIYGGNNGNS